MEIYASVFLTESVTVLVTYCNKSDYKLTTLTINLT